MNTYERLEEFFHGVLPDVPKDKRIGPVIMALTPWWPNLFGPDEPKPAKYEEPIWSQAQHLRNCFLNEIKASREYPVGSDGWLRHRRLAHEHRQGFLALGHDIQAPVDWELDPHWPDTHP